MLIQVDGIRSPQGFSFGAQDVGRGNATDIGLIKSVEILRGPASAFYGSDGLSGAISFTTSDPEDLVKAGNDFGGLARAQYSSTDNEYAGTAAIAGMSGNFSAMLAYSRRDFSELDNQGTLDVDGSARTTPNPQDGESNALLGKLVWNDGNHRLRLTGEYLEREVFSDIRSGRGPVFLFGPTPSWIVDNLTATDTTERVRGSIDWTWQADEEGARLIDYAHLAAYYQNATDRQFAFEERSPTGTRPRPDRERLNTFDNEVYGLTADLRSSFNTGGLSHTLSIGGDVSWTNQKGIRDGTEPPFGEVFPSSPFPETDFTQGGIFVGDALEFGEGAFTLYPALRFDFYDLNPTNDPLLPNFAETGQSNSRFSPKVGAVLKLGNEVRLFGNYAQGFRAPTPSQINNFFENLAFGYTSLANPDLGPETSETFELGIRYTSDDINFTLTGFSADYDDFIDQITVSGSFTSADPAVFQFVNVRSAKVRGVEAKASYEADNGFRARFALALADGEQSDGRGGIMPLETVDPLNAIFGLGYRDPAGKFGGELISTYNARKPASETVGARFRPNEFVIFDATAFVRLADNFTLRAGIFNITDKKYAYWSNVRGLAETSTITDAFTQPGRNASVSLSFQF